MYEKILTERTQPVITPEQLATFGRFDVPQQYVTNSSPQVITEEYQELLDFIEAATDEVEQTAAQSCLNEQILLTFDSFPNQGDHRSFFPVNSDYPFLNHSHSKDSVELVRRPVLVDNLVVTYNDINGNIQTLNSNVYTVFADKITINVGDCFPQTDRRQDCVQISYWAGYDPTDTSKVPQRLKQAIKFLANHFYQVRQIVSVEPTTEVGMTLCRMLSKFMTMRIPR